MRRLFLIGMMLWPGAPGKGGLAPLAAICFFFCVFVPGWGERPHGVQAAPSVLSGQCRRPFPLILAVDYPASRCQAWLNALAQGRKLVPPYVRPRLAAMGLDTRLGMEAVAALLFPVDVVTPEMAPDAEIKVFLKVPAHIGEAADRILNAAQVLVMEMALLLEIRADIAELEKEWPETLAEAAEKMPRLEKACSSLADLWRCLILNQDAGTPDLRQLRGLPVTNPVVALWTAEADIAANFPQRGVDAAAAALRLARQKADAYPGSGPVWRLLQARALFARAGAQTSLGQAALAEADLGEALEIMSDFAGQKEFLARLLLARGELRQTRRNTAGMCADYAKACALGACTPLAEARRSGECAGGAR